MLCFRSERIEALATRDDKTDSNFTAALYLVGAWRPQMNVYRP
jgi:hypothetical protein